MTPFGKTGAPRKEQLVAATAAVGNLSIPEYRSDVHPAAAVQRMAANPRALTAQHVMQLQQTVGNRAVSRLMGQRNAIPQHTIQRKSEPRTGLPDRLKSGVEQLSGMSLDDVRVHYNSSAPSQLGAEAYAQGSDIYVAPGQERHVPHEAWHVVQQAQGRVRPTLQLKGTAVNDDPELEREADVMGARALHAPAGPLTQLKRKAGAAPSVKQLASRARNQNADPLLANGRNLLEDTDRLMAGKEREEVESDKFLDTTYDNVGDNLILDIDMLYEEHLQREIEHNGFFTAATRDVVEVIHEKMNFQALEQQEEFGGDLRKAQINSSLKYIAGGEVENEGEELGKLKANKWIPDPKEDPEEHRMAVGYAKLLKMLETQLPYFGGSMEYRHADKDNLEYWIYHMSTLTKDPQRQYSADSPRAAFPKPMMDYRTRKGGKVPHHNQRNLGTGIVELGWDELPETFKSMMNKALQDVFTESEAAVAEVHQGSTRGSKDSRRHKFMELAGRDDLFEPAQVNAVALQEALEDLWSKPEDKAMREEQRKMIFGDILMVPWSKAHIPTDDERFKYNLGEVPHENVAGVMGNALEMPAKARNRYSEDLKRFENDSELEIFNHERQSGELNRDEILDEFAQKHESWYESAKENHKPIIGGISGHTLGYLNLYEQALANTMSWERNMLKRISRARKAGKEEAANRLKQRLEEQRTKRREQYPKMEVLRASMLGALIGEKRHHSYDEVMAASHGIPTHDDNQQMGYNHPDSYKDVLSSGIGEIKSAAAKAKNGTAISILDLDPNTVLARLIGDRVIPEEERKPFNLKLLGYLQSDLSTDKATVIVNEVNEKIESRKQLAEQSNSGVEEKKEEKVNA